MWRKLTRREKVLAVLAAVALLAVVVLRFPINQQGSDQSDLTERVRHARVTLEETGRKANLTPLEKEQGQLLAELSATPITKVDSGEVTVNLWRWSASSNAQIQGLDYAPSTTSIQDATVVTHRYTLKLQGDTSTLHRFLALVTSSSYRPRVETLAVRHQQGAAQWEMDVVIAVYSQET